MADTSRLEELKRRVQKDPASIAFAQLAEEHRRAGEFEEAIAVCRTGLEQHPGYLSARVTLGRALLETAQYDDAQAELEYVLRAAPDNLAAIRALAEIHQRREEGDAAGDQGAGIREQERTETIELPPLPDEFVPEAGAGLDAALDLAFRDIPDPPESTLIPDPGSLIPAPGSPNPAPGSLIPAPGSLIPDPGSLIPDPLLTELESWLAAILADRDRRRLHGAP